jgi:hypothetical protein
LQAAHSKGFYLFLCDLLKILVVKNREDTAVEHFSVIIMGRVFAGLLNSFEERLGVD